MKGMAKIRLFYSGDMALILPRKKDIAHFVFYDCIKGGKDYPSMISQLSALNFSVCFFSLSMSVFFSFCMSAFFFCLLLFYLSFSFLIPFFFSFVFFFFLLFSFF